MTAATLPNRYLTPEDVAELLALPSVETLYAWRRKRTGPPAFRVGKHLRYDPAELQIWIADLSAREF
jgi:predicted DNA-binding transcriptional regulator AlpA